MHGTYVGEGRILVKTLWGAKLLVSARDLSLMPDLVTSGTYDVPFTAYVRREISAGMVAVDVGANVGLFSVLLAWQVGPTGMVVAYEADQENVTLLRENIAMNYLTPWVEVDPRAVGDRPGQAEFFATDRFRGNSSMLPHGTAYSTLTAGLDTVTRKTVDVVALDQLAERVRHFDLIKIDVEGAESRVLRGMRAIVAAGMVRRIALEVSQERSGAEWPDLVSCLRDLEARGWSCSTIGEDGSLREISVEQVLAIGQFPQVVLEMSK